LAVLVGKSNLKKLYGTALSQVAKFIKGIWKRFEAVNCCLRKDFPGPFPRSKGIFEQKMDHQYSGATFRT